MKAGWRFWALVMPEKATGKLKMKQLVEDTAKAGMTIEIFDDVNEALSWLKDQ